jgi:hypothetical protein
VQALTSTECDSAAAGMAGAASSAVLAALMKVAAVEQPDRTWSVAAADRLQPGSGRQLAAVGQGSSGADQHGLQLAAAVLRRPRLLRRPL